MVYDPERVGQNCEFCGSPALVAYEEIKAPIRPQSLLPFKITAGQVRDKMRAWYSGQLVRAQRAQDQGARRSDQGHLHPLLDVRRAGPRRLDGGERLPLLRHRELH